MFSDNKRALACWDYEKNVGILPEELTDGLKKKIWLICDRCSHSFNKAIYYLKKGSWCPFCCVPPKQLCDSYCQKCLDKSFEVCAKSSQWSSKNSTIPRAVFAGSNKKFLFDCEECGHEFLMALDAVSKGKWCPYCANQKLCELDDCTFCFNKSFACHPKASQWAKINEKSARQVALNSNKSFWFQCDVCPHIFFVPPGRIASTGSWCGYCSGNLLCDNGACKVCLEKSFASHRRASSWSSNNSVLPREVFLSSNKRFLFDCEICGHEFSAFLYTIIAGSWCNFCSNKVLCREDCQICLKKSFASHEFSKFWSPKNTKIPREVFLFSNKRFWFDCEDCGHSFEVVLYSVSQGSFCRFCAHQELCDSKDCGFCFDNSFASHPKVQFWAEENKANPRTIFSSTGSSFLFDCDCGHQFSASLDHISKGKWCPYCGNKKLCDDQNCKTCDDKSLNTHPCSSFWAEKNRKIPREVFRGSHIKVYLICEKGHEFPCAPYNLVAGRWCPLCFRKGEKKLYEFLMSHFDIAREKTFSWCVNKETGKPLRFDFLIKTSSDPKGYRTLIELDGAQHFQQVRNWAPPDETQQRDLYKMRKANKYCYQVVRITWDMVYNDRGNWKEKLLQAIEDVEWHSCAFVCMNGEYDVYEGRI